VFVADDASAVDETGSLTWTNSIAGSEALYTIYFPYAVVDGKSRSIDFVKISSSKVIITVLFTLFVLR
jgi:hypothetical protein